MAPVLQLCRKEFLCASDALEHSPTFGRTHETLRFYPGHRKTPPATTIENLVSPSVVRRFRKRVYL